VTQGLIKQSQIGVGLRSAHYPYLENSPQTKIDWFEALTENYLDTHGRPRKILEMVRSKYPVALHGVSMSLASAEGLDLIYLDRLRQLTDAIEPFLVSDHLCWTGLKGHNVHDLLPFPYNEDSLQVVLTNVDVAQNKLGRSMLLENVSSYMKFDTSDMTEFEFIAEVVKRSGAKILLDINNVYVSAKNLNLDAKACIDAIPKELVGQIHLAGYTDTGEFLFDTHSHPVYPEVWDLFSYFIAQAPNVPFMIEWDENVPEFDRLEEEILKAKQIWDRHHAGS
jgi:uncharacterized protein